MILVDRQTDAMHPSITMDRLQNALQTICNLADGYLRNLNSRADAWVVLTNFVDHDGAMNQSARDRIVMSVYNITREVSAMSHQPLTPAGAGANRALSVAAPLYLDVHLMFTANFAEAKYAMGLAALSRLITYFQQTPTFTQHNAPELLPVIDKLALDFETSEHR